MCALVCICDGYVLMQDLRGCLARELEVSTEEAGEMASTVVHRSNQVALQPFLHSIA